MSTKKYWKSLEHLKSQEAFENDAKNEFSEKLPVDEFLNQEGLDTVTASRRDFLKFLGFSVTAVSLAACEAPVTKSIPYVVKPEEVTPGVPNYYASTYFDGYDYCNILVKTREGRPIFIEGNKQSPITKGGLNARVAASVLSLYDSNRLPYPLKQNEMSDWQTVDQEVSSKLKGIAERGGSIKIVTPSLISPSTRQLIQDFSGKMNQIAEEAGNATEEKSVVEHIEYNPVSFSAISEAHKQAFGVAHIPDYHFDKAKVVVGIDADFLANFPNSIEIASDYALTRNPDEDNFSKHYQFEAAMTLTGSNADVRGAVKPSEYGKVAAHLYNAVAQKLGAESIPAGEISDDNNVKEKIQKAAADLVANKGKSLVVCGTNNVDVQIIVSALNNLLENYGKTIDLSTPVYIKNGHDGSMSGLYNEMKAGAVDGVIFWGVNPVYSSPAEWNFAEALSKTKLSVAICSKNNETSELCDYVCPEHHILESWGDAEVKKGHYSLIQPTIKNVFDTRQGQECLLKWMGENQDYYTYLRSFWKEKIFPTQTATASFNQFWNTSLHDGIYIAPKGETTEEAVAFNADVKTAAQNLTKIQSEGLELFVYPKTTIGEGNQTGNPWLQETADPITKVTWDNYITMNPKDMEGMNTNIQQQRPASVAKVSVNGYSVELPVVPVPGQKIGTVGVALGYGQKTAMVGGELIGKNAYPFVTFKNGMFNYHATGVNFEKTDKTYPIACTQTHHTMMGRKIVNETDISTYKQNGRDTWNPIVAIPDAYGQVKPVKEIDLWPPHDIEKGHRWGMTIDLNKCIGCAACVVSCTAENNVPVVGKDEVRRNREMHWLRIDRYFSSDADPENIFEHGGERNYDAMEVPSAYPEVAHQPVMCQHCNHAPCETVCPVAATNHSLEGLNQMAYNRCIGTRYCANNCPYKVRRFNWFNYTAYKKFTEVNPSQDDLGRMVLNPDVVVRTRGVMEKCSLCVQRIQAGKLQAKKERHPVKDGSIQTACSSVCPTNAITFGDLNDGQSKVRKNAQHDRSYHLLEEIGIQPNIWYMTKVRNTERTIVMNQNHEEESHES